MTLTNLSLLFAGAAAAHGTVEVGHVAIVLRVPLKVEPEIWRDLEYFHLDLEEAST